MLRLTPKYTCHLLIIMFEPRKCFAVKLYALIDILV